jgi:hypothetical protein
VLNACTSQPSFASTGDSATCRTPARRINQGELPFREAPRFPCVTDLRPEVRVLIALAIWVVYAALHFSATRERCLPRRARPIHLFSGMERRDSYSD